MDAPTTAFLGGMPIEVDPTAIDRVLTALWKPATEEAADGTGTTRLALGTLVVVADEARAAPVEAVCQAVAAAYPSRIVVFLVGARDDVSAAVFATCRRAPGGSQVCGETIVLRGGERQAAQLPGLVLPLLLPDVLATLWWDRSEPPAPATVEALLPLTDRGLISLARATDPACCLGLLTTQPRVADLGWFEQHTWREAVAQFFDGEAGVAARMDRVEVVSSGADTAGALLAGWLAGQLGWEPAERRSERHTRWRRTDGEAASVLLTRLPGDEGLWATILSSSELAGDWRVERPREAPGSLRLTAHCRDWCQMPGRLPLPRPDTAQAILAALGRPVVNESRQRATAHAAWLLGG